MAPKLPPTIRLKVEQTLARYADWTGVPPGDPAPEPVRVLGNGQNNCSVLVANERRYVVRVNRHRLEYNALDPAAEQQALRHAAGAGLAPPLRYCNIALGTLVTDYLPPNGEQVADTAALAGLLRDIHALPAIDSELSLPARIRHYELMLPAAVGHTNARAVLELFSERALNCALSLHSADEAPVLCHNDLMPPNVLVSGGRPWAIDWEYAAMGSRWFDIAVACCGAGLDDKQSAALLESYLQRRPRRPEKEQFRWARAGYRYIEWLWYACNQPAADLDQMKASLAEELGE